MTIAFSQKRTLRDMAESINYASSATVADVLAVWSGMEEEIIRTLSNGNRVELGSLGTLSLEVGTERRKSIKEGITSKDIVAKGITFTPSKRLAKVVSELNFECDGTVAHPLSETRAEEALEEYFAKHEYINTRTFARQREKFFPSRREALVSAVGSSHLRGEEDAPPRRGNRLS